MNWMKQSLLCKILAFVLAAAALVGAVFSGIVVGFLVVSDDFRKSPEEFLENYLEGWSFSLADAELYSYVQGQFGGLVKDDLSRTFYGLSENSGLISGEDYEFTIYDMDGRVLKTNRTAAVPVQVSEEMLSVYYRTTEHPSGEGQDFYRDEEEYFTDEAGIDYPIYRVESESYQVTIYFLASAKTKAESMVQGTWEWQLFETQDLVQGIFVGSLLVLVLTVPFLFAAVNHKRGREELVAVGLNRAPLDLLAGVYGFLGMILLFFEMDVVLREIGRADNFDMPGLMVGMAVAFLGSLLIVGWCLSLAAQLKQGGGFWWRNSLTGRILLWMGRVLRKLWKKFCRLCRKLLQCWDLVPLMWHWLVAGAGFLLAFLFALEVGSGFLVVLVIGAAVILVIYNGMGYGMLLRGVQRMSQGYLEEKVELGRFAGQYRVFAENLNSLADAAMEAARRQTASERMRTELITNVSHDIKTPLTSIVNYVDLLQNPHTPEEEQRYLEVLSRQSLRMKKLVEDLVEMSKATTGNMTVELSRVDAAEALHQALGEFSERLERVPLELVLCIPQEPVIMRADGRLVWRVLSNLLGNAVKYAMPGTRFYVTLGRIGGQVQISLKNISRDSLNISADELMERFVRGDTSRNTEGSGLGLNIAKSLMEIQHGSLELVVDGDLFKATIMLPGEP